MTESNCFLEKCGAWFGFARVPPASKSIASLKGELMHLVLKDFNSCFNSFLESPGSYIRGDNLVVSRFIVADEGSAQVVLVAAYAVLRQESPLANLSLVMKHSVQTS